MKWKLAVAVGCVVLVRVVAGGARSILDAPRWS
jgi:hypothetical protein